VMGAGMWARIWIFGPVIFFFLLGCVGSAVCCFSNTGSSDPVGYANARSNDCWWVLCGPTFYNGIWYGNPWMGCGYNDMLCCYLCCRTTAVSADVCSRASCNNCGGCSGGNMNCNGGGGNGMLVLLVIALIIVAIFAVIGVIFGAFLLFVLVNKVAKRQLELMDRRAKTVYEIVADLDDPKQVAEAAASADLLYHDLESQPLAPEVPAASSQDKKSHTILDVQAEQTKLAKKKFFPSDD